MRSIQCNTIRVYMLSTAYKRLYTVRQYALRLLFHFDIFIFNKTFSTCSIVRGIFSLFSCFFFLFLLHPELFCNEGKTEITRNSCADAVTACDFPEPILRFHTIIITNLAISFALLFSLTIYSSHVFFFWFIDHFGSVANLFIHFCIALEIYYDRCYLLLTINVDGTE